MKKGVIFFTVGGAGYALIELMYRGRTHWTMIIAGGICFVICSLIAERFREKPLLCKAFLCAISVTAVELIFGIIFNLILKMNVWDYSKCPFNFLGQICPLFSLLWGALGCIFIPLADIMNRRLKS